MITIKPFQSCSYDEKMMILSWRNDPEIRSYMINNRVIPIEEHLSFVEKLNSTDEMEYYLVRNDERYIGVISLTNIKDGIAELGVYKNPMETEKGTGVLLLSMIHKVAVRRRIQKISLKVYKTNKKALHLYERCGYRVVKEDINFLYMEKDMNQRALIIAEMSANHQHKLEIALQTIKEAALAGADAVKIQTYTPDSITIDCTNEYFQINKGTIWDGRTLYDLYKEAYTPWEWYDELKGTAEALGLLFFSTPFDRSAVDFLHEKNTPMYKIASFEITDIPLIEYTASKGKPMIISTGIAEFSEIQDSVDACRKVGNNNITLLKCTSSYPAPIERANLRTMLDMKQTFRVDIGLSDHTLGKDVAIGAAALGAQMIEKHFIINRNLGGPDVSFSMEPKEFEEMVVSIRNVEKALGSVCYKIPEEERKNRSFARSLFVVEDIKKNDCFSEWNIRSIRPGYGLAPKYYFKVIGKKARRDIKRGSPLLEEDII